MTLALSKTALVASSRSLSAARRWASHSTHEPHQSYPKEGFASPLWRNTVLLALALGAAYKYAPAPTDDAYLTRWIRLYSSAPEQWLELNARHTAQQQDSSDLNMLLSNATVSKVHRLRYPQSLDQGSPFLNGVGMKVDMSGVVAKGDDY